MNRHIYLRKSGECVERHPAVRYRVANYRFHNGEVGADDVPGDWQILLAKATR